MPPIVLPLSAIVYSRKTLKSNIIVIKNITHRRKKSDTNRLEIINYMQVVKMLQNRQ
jgi:hypothetical protein